MPLMTNRETGLAIRLTGLTKQFGDLTAVDGVDLSIEAGEVVALLGPNGAGKSTTIDMMLGLAKPDAGTATIFERQPAQAIADGMVGAMLQSGGLLPDLTVTEIVTLAASLYRKHRPVPEVLERAGVTEFARQRVGRLSGGQQQRVRFAMALVGSPSDPPDRAAGARLASPSDPPDRASGATPPGPDLIVLDEPTTGLDVEARRAFWTAMREETAQGRTVLFATHYLEEADAYADRIVLMRAGTIVADGSPSHIKSLVSGRTIRATLPGADLNVLAGYPGVDSVDTRGDTVLLQCSDSDAALRALLTNPAAHDIEVVAHGLEDAFIALTSKESAK